MRYLEVTTNNDRPEYVSRCAWDWDYLFTFEDPIPFEAHMRFAACYLAKQAGVYDREEAR